MRTLITGYAGFIGSNLTRMILDELGDSCIAGLDCHTYASRPGWVREKINPEHDFMEYAVDLRDQNAVLSTIENFKPDRVYHLAAESHVCRSIDGPRAFAETNFMGTFNLIEALRKTNFKGRMVHVSTDEAFGELREYDAPFDEQTPVNPRSPYSASKCASDLMVKAFVNTYGLDIMTTRCTNNYGPNQHEEKLIPKTILNLLQNKPMSMYGDGSHMRDWIFVDDHCRALISVMENGYPGQLYCVGSGLELTNKQVVTKVATAMQQELNWNGELMMNFTDDRPTDDMRYAVDNHKIKQLGWKVSSSEGIFMLKLRETVRWYAENYK